MPVSLTQEEYYPPQLLAQKLNNKASYHITTGRYKEGIQLLTKALKLIEQDIRETKGRDGGRHFNRRATVVKKETPCKCNACSLESCLIMEHHTFMSCIKEYQSHQEQEVSTRSRRSNGRYTSCDRNDDEMDCDDDQSTPATPPSHLSHVESSSSSASSTTTDDCYDANAFTGFVYQRPLLVNKICIEERHDMGVTLSLIILFNLALAHHLKSTTSTTPCSPKNLRVLQQALHLYELAYQLHVDCIQQQYQQQQEQEQDDSLENDDDDDDSMKAFDSSDDDSLSNTNDTNPGMDNIVDTNSHTTDTTTTTASSHDYNRSLGSSLRFTMIVSNNLGEIHRVVGNTQKHTLCLQHLLSAIMYMVVDSRVVVLDSEMEGFYQNVSPLMLDDVCAQAA